MCRTRRILGLTPLLALLTVAALPAAAQSQAPLPSTTSNQIQGTLLDPHWLPWLGCWEVTADAVDNREVEHTGRRVVCIAPRLDGLGVTLTTRLDDQIIAENTIVADGTARALPEEDCTGEQTASWSADGHRLHSTVDATCANETNRLLIGLSMLGEGGRWIELQSVSFDAGEHRELVVRQYERLDDAATAELGLDTLAPALAVQAAAARAEAADPLDVDDVLEASEIFPVEVVEAAIVESDSLFALDVDALLRLADAGVEDRVIDLMVAISYPDRFVVDDGRSGGGGNSTYVGYSGYVGYYPSCWGRYYSPFWGPYGPGCDPWFYSPYYGYYRPPSYYGGSGNIRIKVPARGSLYGGKVINKRGYATIREVSSSSPDTGVAGALRRAFRRNGGGGGSGVTGARIGSGAGSAGGGAGAVTKSGFTKSRGGSSTGGKAKPRGGGGGH